MQHRSRTAPHTALAAIVAVAACALLGACTTDGDPALWDVELPAADAVAELRAATNCDDLVATARPALARSAEQMWPEDGMWGGGVSEDAARTGGPATTAATSVSSADVAAAPTAEGSPTVIGTNNQEQAVDEADLVKSDGRRLVSLINGVLRVVALDDTPAIDGTLDLSARGATEMFLRGDTVLVLGTTYGGDGSTMAPRFVVSTTLTTVSITDPAAPAISAQADVEGSLVTARDQGGRARVVVQGTPVGLEQLSMSGSRDAATAVVERLSAEDLLPRAAIAGRVEPIGGCADVMVPLTTSVAPVGDERYAPTTGLSTVTVLTVGDDLGDLAPTSIQGSAATVYASADSLFVASPSWDQAGARTDVHRFALGGDGPATYTGSGRAPGTLLNQFSLSERDGALALVTTLDGGPGPAPMPIEPGIGGDVATDVAPLAASSARLTVLDTDGTLDEIGHLDGMSVGEQVQSVRFLGDVAYVVTFRQTDPLYAISLSDPRNPMLLGQLKIPGFSEYLHPVGDGLLLGVGRQVDPATGIDEGLKISLFDVSDPVGMTEVDQIVLPNATSEVSWDHRAFLWDPTRSQAVLPVEYACPLTADCVRDPVGGSALVVRVGAGGLDEIGRFSHEPSPGWVLQPTRSVVVGDDLWTVSVAAIGRSDADAPSSVELLPY